LKVVLLAGGHGMRAKPFTDYIPKAMIPVDGRPVIDHLVRYLARFSEISGLIILCEFDSFGKQIINYFEGKESAIGKPITFVADKKNGTGGALLNVERYVGRDRCFLVWFADNLCALRINDLIHEYKEANKSRIEGITGMVVVRKQRREETGRVVLDNVNSQPSTNNSNNNSNAAAPIKKFIEKGMVKLEQPEAVGIYLFNNSIFRYLHDTSDKMRGCFNLSHDLLAHLTSGGGKLYSYDLGNNIQWLDVESPSYADRNKEIIMEVMSQMQYIL
jgi:mannose-1-phosphate guanylyltransferase